jgi:hypothetical protein
MCRHIFEYRPGPRQPGRRELNNRATFLDLGQRYTRHFQAAATACRTRQKADVPAQILALIPDRHIRIVQANGDVPAAKLPATPERAGLVLAVTQQFSYAVSRLAAASGKT